MSTQSGTTGRGEAAAARSRAKEKKEGEYQNEGDPQARYGQNKILSSDLIKSPIQSKTVHGYGAVRRFARRLFFFYRFVVVRLPALVLSWRF